MKSSQNIFRPPLVVSSIGSVFVLLELAVKNNQERFLPSAHKKGQERFASSAHKWFKANI